MSEEEFIREVNEDMRHKQLMTIWKKYGVYIIIFLVAVLLFVVSRVVLKNYNEDHYRDVANQYGKVEQNIAANNMDVALRELGKLSTTDVGGYKILVAFETAKIQLEKGNRQKAIDALDKLAHTSGVDKIYRDLANFKAAMIAVDTASYDDMRVRLAPLMITGNPWEYMAKELLAMSALTAGRSAEAKSILTEIEQDLEAPEDVKTRAKEFSSVIK
ncbi:MAG: tetratricopeptide repeat protein [Alphaproteobacteria bacterium]|nr:tetratricopeptide repeat protein [Alphaproteobacteria bacterium]